MLFGLSHREKEVKKMNLLHFPVSTLKNFLILELPKPSTDLKHAVITNSYNTIL